MKLVFGSEQCLTVDNTTMDGWYCKQEMKEIELPSTINSQYILTAQTSRSFPSPQLRRFIFKVCSLLISADFPETN